MSRTEACILCHTPINYSVPEIEGYRFCRTCDVTWCLVENQTDPTEGWEQNYYSDTKLFQLHNARKSAMEAIVARLSAVYLHRGHLLDVGAGVGVLMNVAAKDGWSVEGIEPSKSAAESARKLTGATVHNGLLEEIKLPDGHYDVVTIIDTLRHVPDPLTFLYSAHRLLRPGGILLIRETYRAVLRKSKWLTRRSSGNAMLERKRRAFEYAQCFSPKSLLYSLHLVGLDGWVEPSPVFVEAASGGALMASLSKQAVGLASAALYKASGRRVIISPNLLAFGRAPCRASASTASDAQNFILTNNA